MEFPLEDLDKAEDIGPMNLDSPMQECTSVGGTSSYSENKVM